MNTLQIQTLLRQEGLEGLQPLAIKSRRHSTYPNLICLKYDQRLSPMADPRVQEARGLILDENENWNVISMSFKKFFNLEEGHAASIDWSSARVEEKLDGSLMVLYPYRGQYHVQSSGTADATGNVVYNLTGTSQKTFAQLFWETFNHLGYTLPPAPDILGARYSFAFELMTKENQVVVIHPTPRLVLHGVRNLDTLEEEDPETWGKKLGYETVKTFALSRDALRKAANDIPAEKGEGFVVKDSTYNRIKVKSEQYVRISHVRETWNPATAAMVVINGEVDEFCAYFPEYRPVLTEISKKLETELEKIEAIYREHAHITDQKEFAMNIKNMSCATPLFAMRAKKANSAREWLESQTNPAKIRTLESWQIIPKFFTS